MSTIEFHYDFGSPNAYLSHVVIPTIEERTGTQFIYVPVLLGGVFKLTNNQPPMVTLKGIKNKAEYQRLETERFLSRHGIDDFRWNPHFPVNTLLIMRGAVAAERLGVARPYIAAVFRAMWEEERKLDDVEVVREVLDSAGLDGAALLALVQDQAVKDTLTSNTARSVERGTFGSPTFFVGEEIFFGKDRLREVEEEILRSAGA